MQIHHTKITTPGVMRVLQGYPQHYNAAGIHVHTWVERDNVEQAFLSKQQHHSETKLCNTDFHI